MTNTPDDRNHLTPIGPDDWVVSFHVFHWDGHPIRRFVINGNVLGVASDLCKALGVKNAPDLLGRLRDDDKFLFTRSDTIDFADSIWTHFAPQVQAITLVTENGATDLVLDSHKPQAREFRRFLTHVVWPSVRDTGTYSVMPAPQQPALTEDEIIHQALAITTRRVEELKAEVAILEPQAIFAREILDARGSMPVADAASALHRAGVQTGQNRLFKYLGKIKWAHRSKRDGKWRANQAAIEAGFLDPIPQSYEHHETGDRILTAPKIMVTPYGLQRLRELLQAEAG